MLSRTENVVVGALTVITIIGIVVDPKTGLDLAKYVAAGLIGFLSNDLKGDENAY